jgi:hypothetical protein
MNANKIKTVHTSRTIMYSELQKVMDFGMEADNYTEALENNVTGKKSSSGVNKTANYLKQLYGFDLKNDLFLVYRYFWKIADTKEKPLLAFIYAINNDDLLAESIDVVCKTQVGEKATVESFEDEIEKYHPKKYSPNTRKSLAQNIASSWKQAGFIQGKVKNIRIQPDISYRVACFAFFLSYLNDDRGEYLLKGIGIKALCLPEQRLRELAVESAKRDMMQYQYAGSVTSMGFNNLLSKIGINAN